MSDRGAVSIAEAVQCNAHISSLYIGTRKHKVVIVCIVGAQVSDEGAIAIARIMTNSPTLVTFYLCIWISNDE